ncbi:MAG: TonB-dependent receptor [Verrucomicrobia bacterium]|nr:TonB-dependent receptor [Verrucomicrobiota bacterium]
MKRLLLTSAPATARLGLLGMVFANTLAAQSATSSTPAAPKKDEAPQQLERFVVTGSYIPSTETAVEAGASPVVRIDRQAIEESGYSTTAELLQQITASNANSVPISNNATGFTPGGTAISLRGLGPESTLVLINGRRVAPYPVGAGGTTAFVDLNSIPLSAIDAIEVLKDGASALYGADAVAGVINIKLRRRLDGTEVFVSYGNTTDKDSSEFVANVATGAATDKLSVLVGLNFYKREPIMNRDRAYSATPPFLSANSSPANLELSRFAVSDALRQSVNAPIPGLPNFAAIFFAQSGADAGNLGAKPAGQYTYSSDRSSTFNFNEFSMSYPKSKRMGAFVFGERKVFGTDNVKGYVDLSYQKVATENQLAPTTTGDFSTPGHADLVIPARTANPILTIIVPALDLILPVPAGTAAPRGSIPGPGTQFINGAVQRLAAAGAMNPFNPFNQDIAGRSRARLAEFGNRILRNETDAFMFTTGLKGENVAGRWNFDASFSYSSVRDHNRNTLNSASRFNEMVNANSPIFDPRSSAFVGTTTPYNPFGYYRNPIPGNAALIDYNRVTVQDANESSLGQLNFVAATADLWKLPHGSVGLAAGADFRHEQLEQHPDSLGGSGDIIGESPKASTIAQRKIAGVFLEARAPLLRKLEASASVRYEKFFTSGRETTVPKIALRYLPLGNQLTLRTSYSKGFREPSLYELYSSPISARLPIQDPVDGFIEPEQLITLRGNRRLEAEKTDYFNAGFVWSPTIRRLKGLSIGVDRWEIGRKGTVDANPQQTVYRAFGAVPGGLLPGESVLFSASGFISVVNSLFYNVGRTKAAGWDFSGGYQLPTDALGRWELTTVWTLMDRFDRASVQGAPLQSVLGLDSTGSGENGYLEWKGRVNLSWVFKGFHVYLSGMYTDGFEDRKVSGESFHVGDRFIVNSQVSYSFRQRGPVLRDAKISVGAHNLFDWDPPQSIGSGGNTTGYPSHLYTSENRFWYVALSRKF